MVISYAREMDEYTPHPTGGVLTGELNKDLVILENNIPVVGSANLEVEIMSSNIPTISRSRECTVCTSGHEKVSPNSPGAFPARFILRTVN